MTAPAPLKKRLVRFNRLEVNTGTDTTPVWTKVRGLSKIELSIDATEVDVSDFDSGGWDDSLTTHRAWSVMAEGFAGYTGADTTPVEDPGQAALRAKGLVSGPGSYADVRMYRSIDGAGYTGRVIVNWSGVGGEVKGVEPFNCPLKGSGLLSPVTVTPIP